MGRKPSKIESNVKTNAKVANRRKVRADDTLQQKARAVPWGKRVEA